MQPFFDRPHKRIFFCNRKGFNLFRQQECNFLNPLMTQFQEVVVTDPKVTEHGPLPVVMTIAGSDSSGGAGIEADLKTFSAHHVYGMTCITALTAQNTKGVKSIHKVPRDTIKDILDQNFDDFLYKVEPNRRLKAIKLGMLTGDAVEVLSTFLEQLNEYDVKLVLDPVMIATSGSQLFDDEGMKKCIESLMQHTYLVTPNFFEALKLLELTGEKQKPSVDTIEDFARLAVELRNQIECANVLVKGGHIPFNKSTKKRFQQDDDPADRVIVDVLYQGETKEVTVIQSTCIDSQDSHGTGCTLSSSIAANLSKSLDLQDAVVCSIDYIHRAIVNMTTKLGSGNGPLNHTVKPCEVLEELVESSENVSKDIFTNYDSFYEYLKTHPKVKEPWKKYTQNKFLDHIATNKLTTEQFRYFLKQDYYYLINYAQVHALAASVAPTYHQINGEAKIIDNVVAEIERHKKKLRITYDIDYDRDMSIDSQLTPSTACLNYCNYLLKVAKEEDFLGIKIALAPCLHGYHEAGKYASSIEFPVENREPVFTAWIQDYTSDWYKEAHQQGIDTLQQLLQENTISSRRLNHLVEIFKTTSELEAAFWDEVLNI